MVFPNLQALGKFLKDPLRKGGAGRIDQLNKWERFFTWEKVHKDKREIIINKIYEKPIVKEIPIGSRAIYVKHIEIILMQMLAQSSGGSIDISKSDLWYKLGFYNEKYNDYVSERVFLNNNHDISESMILQFKTREYKKFNEILTSALNSLSNRRIIDWSIDTIITDEKGKTFRANDREKDIIRDVEYAVLREFGFKAINQIWLSGQQFEFYNRTSEILKKRYNWISKEKVVHILYTDDIVLKTLEEDIVQLERLALNNLVLKASDQQAITQYTNYLKKIEKQRDLTVGKLKVTDTPEYKRKSKIFFPNFIEIQHRLSQEFIKFINN